MTKPLSITTVNEHVRLPKGQKKITVTRDEDYNLEATLEFDDFGFQTIDAPAGTFIETFDITGSDYNDLHLFSLENCHIGGTKTIIDNEEKKSSMTATIGFSELIIKTKQKSEAACLSEWCLNGPYTPVFSRSTLRKLSRVYSKERFESKDNRIESLIKTNLAPSYSMDFLIVKTDDYQFVIEKVPEGIGPNWSSNIGIEYRTAWGKIPNPAEREEILEILSFLFGRQLLPIGYTAYDKDENVVESYARDPWGRSAKSYCSKDDYPPINIDIWHRGRAETTISQLLPMYHQKCESLCLKEALWNYWVSREMPLGTNLPILSAGVESIIHGWFLNKSNSSVFLDKEKFESLLMEEIQNKLRNISDGDKIMDNILRANQAGIMKSYKIFFDEIKLTITDDEWEAIRERHAFVHGKALLDKTDWHKVAQHVRTFELLFNRILLKLLDYSGTYIDYTAIGCPEVQLT